MLRILHPVLVVALVVVGCTRSHRNAEPTIPGLSFPMGGANPVEMDTVVAYPNLTFTQTMYLTHAGDDTDRVFVVEQPGRIWVVPDDPATSNKTLFLDITGRVWNAGAEEGLLGLAFDPAYAGNGFFYVFYTWESCGAVSVRVSRFTVTGDPDLADARSELVLLEVPQPYANHNGGTLQFGPDGYLYISLGDGGYGGDPHGNGQDLGTLLGSLLRIDVHAPQPPLQYGIPADNPFAALAGARGEIWAYGLRHPWRFSFDRHTGDLWLADVGQNAREEVDLIVKGGNYGWSYREGLAAYAGTPPPGFAPIEPVFDYGRDAGACVIGGYVYRGTAFPELAGAYVYGDFASGRVWALVRSEGRAVSNRIIASAGSLTSFGENRHGELFLCTWSGAILRLARRPQTDPPEFPATLSATGLFTDLATLTPNPHMLPFAPAESFWSDGALKTRWLGIPPGTRIGFDPTGRWTFPRGAVLVKHFALPMTAGDPSTARRLETRVLLNRRGGWSGYVYRWNAAGTDADLLTGAETADFAITDPGAAGGMRVQTWHFPSRTNCLECHTAVQNRVLGPSARQLNHAFAYPTGPQNQLDFLARRGVFDVAIGDPASYSTVRSSRDTGAGLEERARTYLAMNCAQCHQPGGPAPGSLDLRYDTPTAAAGMIDVLPQAGSLGLPGARIVAPRSKESSVLWERMRRLDATRMPRVGSHLVDQAGVDLIGAWIDAL